MAIKMERERINFLSDIIVQRIRVKTMADCMESMWGCSTCPSTPQLEMFTGHGWCRVMGDLMGWAVGQLMTATATVTYTALLFSGFILLVALSLLEV